MALRLSTGLRNKLLGQSTGIAINGSFDTDTVGWTGVGATLSSVTGGQVGNALQVTSSAAAIGQAYQDLTTVVGRIYKLTCYFKKGTSATGRILVGDSTTADSIATSGALSDAAWAQKTIMFIAEATTTRITLQSDGTTSGQNSLFDELSVDEVLDGLKEILRGCKLAIYSGAQPTTADDAATGTLLCTISVDDTGTGLTWGDAANGVLTKNANENWQGTAVATGTAGWFRCYQGGDDPAQAETVLARFDGSISTSGAQINMTSTSITSGAVQTISSFSYTQPAG